MRPRFALLALLAGCCLLLAACAHYALEQPGKLPFDTVYVAPAKNRSLAPQVQEPLTRQLINTLRQAGVRTAASPAEADATLAVTVTDFRREGLATQQGDTGLARTYLLWLTAEATLTGADGQAYFNARTITANEQVFLDAGQQPAEFLATPVLTREMAANIRDLVTSTW
jgi:outer membrane lipopolysaccharide assembly protein LptE/RlpB